MSIKRTLPCARKASCFQRSATSVSSRDINESKDQQADKYQGSTGPHLESSQINSTAVRIDATEAGNFNYSSFGQFWILKPRSAAAAGFGCWDLFFGWRGNCPISWRRTSRTCRGSIVGFVRSSSRRSCSLIQGSLGRWRLLCAREQSFDHLLERYSFHTFITLSCINLE